MICTLYFTYIECRQRIEAWWSQLRRFKTHWWIELCKVCVLILASANEAVQFQALRSEGHYDHSNAIHQSVMLSHTGVLVITYTISCYFTFKISTFST